jgi:N-acetylglucosaminyldiphosphoundecaprenol N-acetyl-beta-D-mannosaminyltransferase
MGAVTSGWRIEAAGMVDFQRDVYCLLGLPFDALDMESAARRIRQAVAQRTPCFFSTPNLNFLIGCRAGRGFRDSVIQSDLSIADGMPIVWIARLLGLPIHERVAGSDLFDYLRKTSDHGMSVYFFGGMQGVAAEACRRLNAESSGMTCAGHECPGFGSIEDMSGDESIKKINASGADFLLVSLGAQKGQAWIIRNRARISVPVISHLGAVLNFVAGSVNRAPIWMRRTGLEWLWRMLEEPALWRRYFRDGVALTMLLVTRIIPYAWHLAWRRPELNQNATSNIETHESETVIVINLRGAWGRRDLMPLRECFSGVARAGKDVCIDASGVTYIDSAFAGLLVLLYGHLQQHRRYLRILSAPRCARRILKYVCADFLLDAS